MMNPISPNPIATIKDKKRFFSIKCQWIMKGKVPQIKPIGVLTVAGKGSLSGHKLLWQLLHFRI